MAEALLILASLAGNVYLVLQLRRAGRTILEREAQNKIARMEIKRWQEDYWDQFLDRSHRCVFDSGFGYERRGREVLVYCKCGSVYDEEKRELALKRRIHVA